MWAAITSRSGGMPKMSVYRLIPGTCASRATSSSSAVEGGQLGTAWHRLSSGRLRRPGLIQLCASMIGGASIRWTAALTA